MWSNNNYAIIRKITVQVLRSDKRRNFYITGAIALTALLLTTVFSIGIRFYQSSKAQGIDFSGQIPSLASLVILLMTTGYLLVYNVLYISVSRNVRFYGMLKTIGTTPKQIRHIVVGQVMRLCISGIPLGLVMGVFVSFVMIPIIFLSSNIETEVIPTLSPLVYIGAIIFTVIFTMMTAFLGAATPSKKAARISAIEALRNTGASMIKNKAHSLTHGKLYKMAFRNIFRDRKRAFVVLLSLFMGMTIFIIAITFNASLDVDNYVSSQIESDFILKNEAFETRGDSIQVFNTHLLSNIQKLPGIEKLQPISQDILLTDNKKSTLITSVNIDVISGHDEQTLVSLHELINGHDDIELISRLEEYQSMNDSKTSSLIMSGVMAFIIGLIGIMNFINVMSVGIMARKHELAALESIGMSKKQLRQMLIYEGLGYGIITLALAVIPGNAIAYGNYLLWSNQWNFMTFTYPVIPVLIVGCIILSICIVVPVNAYRSINQTTIAERLKESE